MSDTKEWNNRLANKRWSQDDRQLSWKFQKEIDAKIDAFLAGKEKTLVIGEFNLKTQPWRLLAVSAFRKYGLKVCQKASKTDKNLVALSLVKCRLQTAK